jgi:hypothetical protein
VDRISIIFVSGVKPKPPLEMYRRELCRVLAAGLATARPEAAARFEALHECLKLVPWTYHYYGTERDITLDLPGIERLLREPTPAADDVREVESLARRLRRWSMLIGDAIPWIGRLLVQPDLRLTMHEVGGYLKNVNGIGDEIRAMLKKTLDASWSMGSRVLLIGHSLGSVIAYDTLWELSQAESRTGRVDLFLTLGSPLGTCFVRRRLRGMDRPGRARFPTLIRRWINFSARGELTALRPALRPFFGAMVDLGLLESFADHTDIYNHYHGDKGLNVHDVYGYLFNPRVASTIADWLVEES